MSTKQGAYRQIVKASSILGAAQVINIITAFVRTKLVAVLIGTTGVGILGLLNAPLNFIAIATGLGIKNSAVRDISEAAATEDHIRISKVIKIFRMWVIATGIVGMATTLILAPWLSKWTFNNSNYTWTFVLLSVTLFINAINSGQNALLQGLRKLKYLAKASVIGLVLGLITSVPLYYYAGIDGIPYAIVIAALANLMVSWFYARKVKTEKGIVITLKEAFLQGNRMAKLGITLTVSGMIGMGVRYLINAYISRVGSIEEVGLYQAGFSFISTYVGMIFTTMGSDYYPRLAAVNNDNKKSCEAVNNQITIAVTVLAPICAIILTFLPIIVRIVYTSSFLEIIPMAQWLVISIFIKAVVWALGYLYLAKGDLKTAFFIDNILNIVLLFGYIYLYKLLGLVGVGIADLLFYSIALPFSYIIANRKYGFKFTFEALTQIVKYGVLLFGLFIMVKLVSVQQVYLYGSLLTIVIGFLALKDLDKQLDLKGILKNKISR